MKGYKEKMANEQAKRNAWIVRQVVDKGRTPTQVAAEVGLTDMRVRQIVKAAEAAKEGVA